MRIASKLTIVLALFVGTVAIGEDAKPVNDNEFVMKAASGGLFEVESSKLAKERATSGEVKKFAERMITDHTKANQELMQTAKKANIEVPKMMAPKHQMMYDKVKEAKGAEFDRIYMDAQNAAHEEAISLFMGATEGVKNPELKAFAEKTLPVLKEHHELVKKHTSDN
jgi:putative membrane protein